MQSTGKMRISRISSSMPLMMCSSGQRALFEELLHQVVFAFGDDLDEFLMGVFGGVGVLGGNLDLFALAVAVDGVDVGLHADQVDDAAEVFVDSRAEAGWGRRCGRSGRGCSPWCARSWRDRDPVC